jgi:hypothetical protein
MSFLRQQGLKRVVDQPEKDEVEQRKCLAE